MAFTLFFFYIAPCHTQKRHTQVSIEGNQFFINKQLTYKGRYWNGRMIEGLLMNSRMVQGIFNDLNLSIYGKYKLAHGGSIGVNAFYSLGLNSWELYNGVSESFNHYGIGVSYYFK